MSSEVIIGGESLPRFTLANMRKIVWGNCFPPEDRVLAISSLFLSRRSARFVLAYKSLSNSFSFHLDSSERTVKAKRNPRLADISSNHSNAAPDMPIPAPPQENLARRKRDAPAIPRRSRFRWSNRPAWTEVFLAACGVLLLAGIIFFAASMLSDTLRRNQQLQSTTDAWRQLLDANVAVTGSPTKLDQNGMPRFPWVSFENVHSQLELHQYLRLATALPGIQRVSLAPESTRYIGRGHADDATLQILADNFKELDSLDLSGTNITTLKPIEPVKVRELKIINATIKLDNLSTLQWCSTVSELWVGWHGNVQDTETIYFSDIYKQRLVKAMSKMKSLNTVHLYEMTLEKEERDKLPGVNLIQIK